MTINFTRAKKLCSDAEMRLVDETRQKQLAKLSEPQLKQRITRAKKQRDKWKDKSREQRRREQEKQGRRAVTASVRSQSKADLFDQVLERFQQQLAKNSDADGLDNSGGKKAAQARSSGKKTKAKSPAKKRAPKASSPKKSAPKSLKSINEPHSIAEKKPPKKKQRKAETSAKQAKVKKSGLTSRVRGHVSARTRRSQAKRDA